MVRPCQFEGARPLECRHERLDNALHSNTTETEAEHEAGCSLIHHDIPQENSQKRRGQEAGND